MSFLKELQLQHGALEVPHVSLEEINISLEGLSLSKIKELIIKGIKKIKDFFLKIFKWIKEKVLKFFKSKRVKEIREEAKIISNPKKEIMEKAQSPQLSTSASISLSKSISDTDSNVLEPPPKIPVDPKVFETIYSDDDIKLKISTYFDGKFYLSSKIFNHVVFTPKLWDFEECLKVLENKVSSNMKILDKVSGYFDEYKFFIDEKAVDLDKFYNEFEELKIYKASGTYGNIPMWSIYSNVDNNDLDGAIDFYNRRRDNYHKNPFKFYDGLTKEELFKWNDRDLLDKYFKMSEDFYKNSESKVWKVIDKFTKAMNSSFNKRLDEVSGTTYNYYQICQSIINFGNTTLKLLTYPSETLSTYIQLLDYICKQFASKEYLIDPNPPKYKHLYHLSDDPQLINPERNSIILYPLKPVTGGNQLLPPRISFCEDMLNCCYGTPKYFISNNDEHIDEDGLVTNIYKQKNKFGEATYSKARRLYLYEGIQTNETKFIKPEIVLSTVGEAAFSKEICVVSDIKVKKVAKVAVYYDHTVPMWHPRKFARMEIIEEY